MPKFSKQSKDILRTCHWEIQQVMNEAIGFVDFKVLRGHSSKEEQQKLFDQGFSKKKGGESKHNYDPSRAIDIAPYPIVWPSPNLGMEKYVRETARWYYLAGVIQTIARKQGIILRVGLDWDQDQDFGDQTFMDLGHYELPGSM